MCVGGGGGEGGDAVPMQLCNGPFHQKDNLIWPSLIDLDAILEVYTVYNLCILLLQLTNSITQKFMGSSPVN